MVIGPPYDCWVTFGYTADLIVFYCIKEANDSVRDSGARVLETGPIFSTLKRGRMLRSLWLRLSFISDMENFAEIVLLLLLSRGMFYGI